MQIARRAVLVGMVARAWAQEAPTYSTDVKVVSVLATVHDRDGRVVKELAQDDFTLLEDGAPQKVRYFSRETGLPLTIGLLVDTSRSQTGVAGTGAARLLLVSRPHLGRERRQSVRCPLRHAGRDSPGSDILAARSGGGAAAAPNPWSLRDTHL